jgi:hypothetical protein
MNYDQSEYKYMSVDELYTQRDDISFLMVEAEGEDLETLESQLEEIEELITLKEAGCEELDFE